MKFENTEVYGIKAALRGMRNPMESWEKGDTKQLLTGKTLIGKNDLILAQKLISAGTDHSKFLRQIFVSCDITASLYWWKEADTYKVATTANSTSTMHKITTTPISDDCFMLDDFEDYKDIEDVKNYIIQRMEYLRNKYLTTKDRKYWRALIQLNPQAWEQTRTWTADYAVLRNMYHARKHHKLKEEWVDLFCKWVESLPYSKELILGGDVADE